MFIQVMNRVINEAMFQTLAGQPPGRASGPEPAAVTAPAPTAKARAVAVSKAAPSPVASLPATVCIYASAFNTAVHGG